MIITVTGLAGSGKSTIAREVAKRLGFRHYSVGDKRRERAKIMGLTILEYNKLGDKDPDIDRWEDEWQRQLGQKQENFVIDGRLSWHFIPQSVKILLLVSELEAAKRLSAQDKAERRSEPMGSLEEAREKAWERNNTDKERYMKLYGVDIFGRGNFDLVIDTTGMGIGEVVERAMVFIRGLKNPGQPQAKQV